MKKKLSGFSSLALHHYKNNNSENAHLVPIYATSTFTYNNTQEGADRFTNNDKEKIYSRWGNPTFKAVEETIAAMEAFGINDENGNPLQLKALLHSSGQAAMTTLFLSNLKAGEALLTHFSLYGGTYELLHKVLQEAGIEIIVVDFREPKNIEEAFAKHPKIKLVHIETPANPTIQCIDIETCTTIAKRNHCMVSVDNTFATPYLQQPFKYGVDFVFHSTTKYLNGHGTAIGGILIGKDVELMKTKVWKWHVLLGGNANAFDAFLLSVGLKTLELRMDKHCSNALQVATYLQQHPKVQKVNYNGLPNHQGYAITQKQMHQAGAMLSFEVKGGLQAGIQFMDALEVCVRAVSLGTVDTLVSHPASTTHVNVPKTEREKFDISDGLIRMSVGIENVEDIISDLEQALFAIN